MSVFTENDLYTKFDELNISFQKHVHEPLFTVEDSQKLRGQIKGGHCKNLFLKSKKNSLHLLVVLEDKRVDLKTFEKGLGKGRLSFGKPELLMEVLGVILGAVTPFSVINDDKKQVEVLLDREMLEHDILNYHPLHNEATISISSNDLLKFIKNVHSDPKIIDVPVYM